MDDEMEERPWLFDTTYVAPPVSRPGRKPKAVGEASSTTIKIALPTLQRFKGFFEKQGGGEPDISAATTSGAAITLMIAFLITSYVSKIDRQFRFWTIVEHAQVPMDTGLHYCYQVSFL
jgi:hypothetical protein